MSELGELPYDERLDISKIDGRLTAYDAVLLLPEELVYRLGALCTGADEGRLTRVITHLNCTSKFQLWYIGLADINLPATDVPPNEAQPEDKVQASCKLVWNDFGKRVLGLCSALATVQ